MKFFYIATSPNSKRAYQIHQKGCELIPNKYERDYLGPFNACHEAVRKASAQYQHVEVCSNCCDTTEHRVVSNFEQMD